VGVFFRSRRGGLRRRHELSDEQWARIERLLPGRDGDPGKSGADNRLFVNAGLWIARTGTPWRDLPEHFGKWNSVFQRFNRWCKQGVWQRVAEVLGDDPDLEHLLLDSTAPGEPPPTVRSRTIQASQCHRTILQPRETLSPRRDALRENRYQRPGVPQPRFTRGNDPVSVNTT